MIPLIVSGKTELGGLECMSQPSTGWLNLPMTKHNSRVRLRKQTSTSSARIQQDRSSREDTAPRRRSETMDPTAGSTHPPPPD